MKWNLIGFSLLGMIGTGLWNYNLIQFRRNARPLDVHLPSSKNEVMDWFRYVFIVTGIICAGSFIFVPPSTSFSWNHILYSSLILITYQFILLYILSQDNSPFPLIIINLNIALLFFYECIYLGHSISWIQGGMISLYILVGSIVIYLRKK